MQDSPMRHNSLFWMDSGRLEESNDGVKVSVAEQKVSADDREIE